MSWNGNHQHLLDSFAKRFGLPALDSDSARAWTMKLAEQFNFTFSAERWGTKRADPGRPMSTDVICTRDPFLGYDVIIGQGTPDQHLADNPEAVDLAGQIYIAVSAINHLGSVPPVEQPPAHVCPPPPVTYPYPDEPTAIKAYQDRVKAAFNEAGRQFPDPNDSDAFRWFTRYAYDCKSMPEPEAANKHIHSLRQALGLS